MPPTQTGQCGFGFERFHIDLDGRAFTPDLALFDGQVCVGPIQNQDRCFRPGQTGVALGGSVQINHAP
jgi:hypothetical protein